MVLGFISVVAVVVICTTSSQQNAQCFSLDKVLNLKQYCLLLVPNDNPLWIETCTNTQCYSLIEISKEEHFAFSCLSAVNWLSTVHRTDNIKFVMDAWWNC